MTIETVPQSAGEPLVAFDRDHPGAGRGKDSGNRAVAGAQVEDEIALTRAGCADKPRDQPAVTQKMGAGRVRRRWRPPGHGRP